MRLARAAGRARSVHPPGVDHGGRREPHDQRAPRARPGAGRADPVHTGAHDVGRAARGGAGTRGGGPSGQVRETAMRDGTIERAIADIRAGKLVIVADDEDRENEGDLVGAAEQGTPEMINFMATHGRGLICLTLTPQRCQALGLSQMAEHNTEARGTASTVSSAAAPRLVVTAGTPASARTATQPVAIGDAAT